MATAWAGPPTPCPPHQPSLSPRTHIILRGDFPSKNGQPGLLQLLRLPFWECGNSASTTTPYPKGAHGLAPPPRSLLFRRVGGGRWRGGPGLKARALPGRACPSPAVGITSPCTFLSPSRHGGSWGPLLLRPQHWKLGLFPGWAVPGG